MSNATDPARTVLVTGGNRGIGLACAQRFADQGHRVAITYRSSGPDDDRLLGVQCDQSDGEQVDAAFATITAELGAVEVLVANAGITSDQLLLRMSDEDFSSVIDTNLVGAYRMAKRAARPMLRARWGRLVFVSSVVALTEEQQAAITAAVPLGRVASPDELADVIAFIASDSAAYVSGAVIPVDGGLGMGH